MAIIRFLDKNKACYQVSPPETPVLIYLNPEEKKTLLASKDGECLFLIADNLSTEEARQVIEALNTTDDVKTMN